MNAMAQQIADTIKVGSVIVLKGRNEEFTVSHFKGKSVWFTNNKYENLRSLHNYTVKSI